MNESKLNESQKKINPPNPSSGYYQDTKQSPYTMSVEENNAILQEVIYSKEEVAIMTDAELLSAFTGITGEDTATCSHCHRTDGPLEKFIIAIRRRCEKKGIFAEMKLPKTCDRALQRNEKRNKIANTYYYRIKKAETEEEKVKIRLELKAAVEAAA